MPDRFFADSSSTICLTCTRKRGHTTIERFDPVATHRIDTSDAPDLDVCLIRHRPTVTSTVNNELGERRGLKLYLTATVSMSRHDVDGTVHTTEVTLRSEVCTVLTTDDIDVDIDRAIACLLRRLEAYMREGEHHAVKDGSQF